ncbi:MAG TPA: metal ABC transporter substrate-binding protein [Acidimicrobiales bacterium]
MPLATPTTARAPLRRRQGSFGTHPLPGRRSHRGRLAFATAAGWLVALAAACGGGGATAGGDRLQVATTVAPITSIAAAVGGDLVDIEGIVPEGTNSHTFEPPPSAAAVLARADVLFVNGLQLEEPTEDLAEANLADGAVLVELGDETIGPDDYKYDFSFPEEGGKPNPHLWTNPPMAERYAEVVKDTLVAADPAHADAYQANYAAFSARVDQLDAAVREATATLDPSRRKLLTYHDAYAYFADEYGWEVVGAIQPSDFAEPSPREVADLISQVRDEGVPAIFGSEVFPSPVLEQIGDEAGIRYVDELRDDDLPGEPGDDEHSWLGLMRFDYITMVESLGGDASALEAVPLAPTAPDQAEYPQ